MALLESLHADPLHQLHRSVGSKTPAIPTFGEDDLDATDVNLSLGKANFLQFHGEQPMSFDLGIVTRFVSATTGAAVDLRSIYFAWLMKDVTIPEYIAATEKLNLELSSPEGAGGQVQHLSFVERLDLITWLEGASEESQYIQKSTLVYKGESIQKRKQSQASLDQLPAPSIFSARRYPRGGADLSDRSEEIYALERPTADRNTLLHGEKPADFSEFIKDAEGFLGRGKQPADTNLSKLAGPSSSAATSQTLVALPKKSTRRVDPIILLSPSASALLRLSNIKSFLEDGIFDPIDASAASDTATILHISRLMPNIDPTRPMRFIIVDSSEHFKPDYWTRLVAVFTTGQAWQFKSYKWQDPLELFKNTLGIYVGYRNEELPTSVQNWGKSVMTTAIDKWVPQQGPEGRWRDREVVESIWSAIEETMRVKVWAFREAAGQ
ncbi:MAG: accessory factor associated with RNA polymerase II [Trizodia sp. TS-e1964]|nr:MAG: accessory factor associated with RNA polymerase II [Trizodia sp. TS-e1964]